MDSVFAGNTNIIIWDENEQVLESRLFLKLLKSLRTTGPVDCRLGLLIDPEG